MPIVPFALKNGFYQSESPPVSSQMALNMYPNIPNTQGVTPDQLFRCPGLMEVTNTGIANINRGGLEMAYVPYFVNGNELVRLNEDGTFDVLGTVEGTGQVSMADNGNQLCVVVFGTGIGYIYSEATGFVQITDPDFTAIGLAEIVVYIDAYFIFTTPTRNFFSSDINNGLAYNALDYGSAEADPDVIRSAIVYKSQLYIMGSETIEVFRNVGGTGFPFERITGYVIPKGIVSPFSVTEFNGGFVWIGAGPRESARIFMFAGGEPILLSNTSINFYLQSEVPDLQQMSVFNYTYRGAVWVGWSSKIGTFVYDAFASEMAGGQQIWHLRQSSNLQGGRNRWRGTAVVEAYGQLFVGDTESGRIGAIQSNAFTDYDNPINRAVNLPTIMKKADNTFHNAFIVDFDGGQATQNGDGSNPMVSLQYSDDGRVFNYKPDQSLGPIGAYRRKIRWNQLGYVERYRIYRITFTAPIEWVIFGIYLDHD